MWKTFANAADIARAFKGDGGKEYMPGKGWYEWPLLYIQFPSAHILCNDCYIHVGRFPNNNIVFSVILLMTTFL